MRLWRVDLKVCALYWTIPNWQWHFTAVSTSSKQDLLAATKDILCIPWINHYQLEIICKYSWKLLLYESYTPTKILKPYLACSDMLYNLHKDSCPPIGWITFIIFTNYKIRCQNIPLHSAWVSKSAKISYHCTQHSHLLECSLFPIQTSDVCSPR